MPTQSATPENRMQIHGNYTATQRRTIELAITGGNLSNKALANAEGVTPDAIQSRWDRIADTLQLPWGQRTRAHVIAALHYRKAVEYLMLTLAVLIGSGAYQSYNNDNLEDFTRLRHRRTRVRNTGSNRLSDIEVDYEWGGIILLTQTQNGALT